MAHTKRSVCGFVVDMGREGRKAEKEEEIAVVLQ
jgi:hypothetical protein